MIISKGQGWGMVTVVKLGHPIFLKDPPMGFGTRYAFLLQFSNDVGGCWYVPRILNKLAR